MVLRALVETSNSGDGVEIPSKPDLFGRKRPPRAPREWLYQPISSERDASRIRWVPPEDGPLLECYTPNHRVRWGGFAAMTLLLVGFLTLTYAGFGWIFVWWNWVIVAAAEVGGYLRARSSSCAAGAEWFLCGDRWVRQYELVSVKVRGKWQLRYLRLADRDGRKVSLLMRDAQAVGELWDLVYNGVLHSVASGAEANASARRALKLQGVADR